MATEAIFVKQVQTVVGMIYAKPIRTEKVGKYPVLIKYSEDHIIGSWKISRAHKLFRRSQNWSSNSSRILAITREVENGFCTNSSYLSSEKYCWNSISSD